MRKPVFGVFDQAKHKPGGTATEDGWRLEISDLGKMKCCTIYVGKTKAAKLICTFVFIYVQKRSFLMTRPILG